MRRAVNWVVEGTIGVLIFAALKWIWSLTWKLAENGLVGWADDRIADAFGIKSQTIAAVVNLGWSWGIPLLAVAALMVLYHWWNNRWGRGASKKGTILPSLPRADSNNSERERRTQLIRQARQFAVDACRDEGCSTDFRAAAEGYGPYFELRPHMSEEFQRKMAASRTAFVPADGSHLPALASWFLEELDLLERKWTSGRKFQKEPEKPEPPRPEQANLRTRATGAVGVALPPARYTKAEIRAILEAISAFHPELVEIEKILMDGLGTVLSMEAIIRDSGPAKLLDQLDQLRLRLIIPTDRIKAAVHKFSLYREVCNVLNGFEVISESFFGAYNDLAALLRELPDKLSAPALKLFVEARKQTFITRADQYLAWAKQKKLALENYREWYLRSETTD